MSKLLDRFKCFSGFHVDAENIGAGRGGLFVYGHTLAVTTIIRLWKCKRCGAEYGTVECSEIEGFKERRVDAEFARGSTGFKMLKPSSRRENRVCLRGEFRWKLINCRLTVMSPAINNPAWGAKERTCSIK